MTAAAAVRKLIGFIAAVSVVVIIFISVRSSKGDDTNDSQSLSQLHSQRTKMQASLEGK